MKKLSILCLLLSSALLLGGCNLFYTSQKVDTAGLLVMEPTAHPTEKAESSSGLQLGNPWQDYESLTAAMEAAACPHALEEELAGCSAEVFRVMNGELLEVRYVHDGAELTLRWSAEEDADISGVYADFDETIIADYADGSTTHHRTKDGAEVILFHFAGRGSWSLYAPTGFPAGASAVFTSMIHGN